MRWSQVRRRIAIVEFGTFAFSSGFGVFVRSLAAALGFELESFLLELYFETRRFALQRGAFRGTAEGIAALAVRCVFRWSSGGVAGLAAFIARLSGFTGLAILSGIAALLP